MQAKQKVTLYLSPELHKRLKVRRPAIDSELISELAERALGFYLEFKALDEDNPLLETPYSASEYKALEKQNNRLSTNSVLHKSEKNKSLSIRLFLLLSEEHRAHLIDFRAKWSSERDRSLVTKLIVVNLLTLRFLLSTILSYPSIWLQNMFYPIHKPRL